jgi:hypothetical protein
MFLQEPHSITSEKTAFFIVTTVKTSNLTCDNFFSLLDDIFNIETSTTEDGMADKLEVILCSLYDLTDILLSKIFSRGTDKNHKNLSPNSQGLGRRHLEQTCRKHKSRSAVT